MEISTFSSVTQSCLTLCDPMDCSTPGLPVHHQLLEFTQTHAHWVADATQPSHPLSSPSPATFTLSQHQGHFKWVSSLHQVAKVSEFQLQHQSFQWIQDWSPLGWTGWISLQSKGLSRVFSNSTVQKHQFFSTQLYVPTFTSIHDYWNNRIFDETDLCWQMSLLFNMLPRLVIAFLPRSKGLLISWLKSASAVILEPLKIKALIVSIAFPSICHEVMGLDAIILFFWILSFKPTFSLSSFTFIQRLFNPLCFLP